MYKLIYKIHTEVFGYNLKQNVGSFQYYQPVCATTPSDRINSYNREIWGQEKLVRENSDPLNCF